MEARILSHEEAEPALDMVGRRHPCLDPVLCQNSGFLK